MKIILLTKTTEVCERVISCLKKPYPDAQVLKGERGDPFPGISDEYDYMISFLSPWIIPADALSRAKTAINFHPAPPEYPGTGCYNFAIYERAGEYGATCHHMLAKVDTGSIVKVRRFPMGDETVQSLKEKTMQAMEMMFYDILEIIRNREELPVSSETWKRKPFTRKDLQALCRMSCDMPAEEIERRVAATYFPGAMDSPYIEVKGMKFLYRP